MMGHVGPGTTDRVASGQVPGEFEQTGRIADAEIGTELAQIGQRILKLYEYLDVALREKYPLDRVFFCPYGIGVYEMIDRLNQGKLPGV